MIISKYNIQKIKEGCNMDIILHSKYEDDSLFYNHATKSNPNVDGFFGITTMYVKFNLLNQMELLIK